MMLETQLFDAPVVDGAGVAGSPIDNISLFEQKLTKISAVLTSNHCYGHFLSF
jgi:hypothetical protein